ncbi:hypothetical protein [Jannaschia sp. LMIT008]|uniref:hypothetical protein n=1 Tax=Jannaschia maritima TaxID=3032585 RepID=UPI0028117D28|nr:hypothetical protein [Jannaschia sp. LMIT008]
MPTRRTVLTAAAALPFATPLRAAQSDLDRVLKVREFYNRMRGFSDTATALEGERITVEGFMAPPLKADSRFFVLTKMPMSVCPFCETAAEWPDDIMAVYTKRTVDVIPFNVKIETRGVLELGEFRDPDTGFVSLVRLADSVYER